MMALARTMVVFSVTTPSSSSEVPELALSQSLAEVSALGRLVFNSVCTELRRRGPPSLLYSDNSVEVPTLVRPDNVIIICPYTDFIK